MSFRAQGTDVRGRSGRAAVLFFAACAAVVALALPASASAVAVSHFSVTPSTTVKSAKPALTTRVVRTGTLAEGIKSTTVKYPAGLQLALPATRCSTAQFNADNCPAGSLVGAASAQGVAASKANVALPGNGYALANGSIGFVLRPSGLGRVQLTQTLSAASGSVTAVTSVPKTIKLLGLLDVAFSASELKYEYKNPLVTNPATCGTNTSNLSLIAWNSATATRTATFDTTGCPPPDTTIPVVDITSPLPGNTPNNPVTVVYTVSDNDPAPVCTITRNNQAVGNPVTLVDGPNTIVVSCRDAAGNTGTDSVTVSPADISVPVVQIASPQDGAVLTDPQVNVSWSAFDNDPILTCAVTVNGAPQGGTVGLQPGLNVIRVACTDRAGNTGSDEVRVIFEPPPIDSVITKFASPSAPAGASETVEFSGGSSYQCRVDSGAWSPCVSPWSLPTAGLSAPQLHTYDVRAVSGAAADPTPARGHIWIDNATWSVNFAATPLPNSLTPAAVAQDAGRHPDLQLDLAFSGHSRAASVELRFPDGLMANLSAINVLDRCSVAQASTGSCPASSRIGSVSGVVTSPRDGLVTAEGDLFFIDTSDPAYPADVSAAVAVELELPDGLGRVRTVAHLKLPRGDVRALRLTMPNLPDSTDPSTSSETRPSALRFHSRSLTLNVDGDVGGESNPARSLITNPHYCGPAFTHANWANPNQKRFVLGATAPDGTVAPTVAASYEVLNCAAQQFSPVAHARPLTLSGAPVTAAGEPFRLFAGFELPPESAGVPNATLGRAAIQLPPQVSPNFAAFGSTTNMCPISTVKPAAGYSGYQWFDPISPVSGANVCTDTPAKLASSRIGTATISTPIAAEPLSATVYLIDRSAIPLIGVAIDPNPEGISTGFVITSTVITDPDTTLTSLALELDSLPDLPISRLEIDIGNNGSRPTGHAFFALTSPTDPSCLPKPADDPETPFDDSTAQSEDLILRLRPWSRITSDAMMRWPGATFPSLVTTPAPGDVELHRPIPITGCELP